MDIPFMTHEEHGGDLKLYQDVYQYSNMFVPDADIAKLTNTPINTIRVYKSRLKKTVTTVPADQMTEEALYGYLAMSDIMLQDMMQVYLEMREDRDIYRNNVKTTDNKRRLPVHPKDMIALMQTLMKTQLERAAVLTKFSAVKERKASMLPSTNKESLSANALMDTNVVDVEFTSDENILNN